MNNNVRRLCAWRDACLDRSEMALNLLKKLGRQSISVRQDAGNDTGFAALIFCSEQQYQMSNNTEAREDDSHMKRPVLIVAALTAALLARALDASAGDKEKDNERQKNSPPSFKQSAGARSGGDYGTSPNGGGYRSGGFGGQTSPNGGSPHSGIGSQTDSKGQWGRPSSSSDTGSRSRNRESQPTGGENQPGKSGTQANGPNTPQNAATNKQKTESANHDSAPGSANGDTGTQPNGNNTVPSKSGTGFRSTTTRKGTAPGGTETSTSSAKAVDGTRTVTPPSSWQSRSSTIQPAKSGPGSTTPAAEPKLAMRTTAHGGYVKTAPSGMVRERLEKKPDGEHVQHMTPTGKVATEVVKKSDGTEHVRNYGADGKTVRQEVVKKPDGSKEITHNYGGIGGKTRATETVQVDKSGKEVSKTVVVKQQTALVKNTTIVNNNTTIVNNYNNTTIVNNTHIVRHYDRGHYGYVYRPVYVVHSPMFVSWYDPYWYPGGVLVYHPFSFYWGWESCGWYHCHRHYWHTYEVYPAPCYWVTDWMIAGYMADRYAVAMDAAQAREDARIAREEAAKAMQLAQQAKDAAEIAEANRAREEAEVRAAKAETRAAKAEAAEAKAKALAGQPNPNATPIDEKTKEELKNQIEREIASKKQIAEETSKGGKPVIPDLSQALADPKHIYPVSKAINVISAKDQSPAGVLTEGDLLKLEPGQESTLKDADENTFVTMRVMTSKGEEGEVLAGTLVSIPLKDLQEFDSEFRAKLDLGLAEADKNKDQFKQMAKK